MRYHNHLVPHHTTTSAVSMILLLLLPFSSIMILPMVQANTDTMIHEHSDATTSTTTTTTSHVVMMNTNHNVVPSVSDTRTTTTSSTTGTVLPPPPLSSSLPPILPLPLPTGIIADLSESCPMDDIEHVNTVQLYEILQNLKHLSIVRNIQIDLQPNKCIFSPLLPSSSSSSSSSSHSSSRQGEKSKKKKATTTTKKSIPNFFAPTKTTLGGFQTAPHSEHPTTEGQCSGGAVSEELDDDAEPLCTVQGIQDDRGHDEDSSSTTISSSKSIMQNQNPNPFTPNMKSSSSSSSLSVQSNVLHQLQQTGFTSQSQQDTFTWRDMTDTVFTEVSAAQGETTTNHSSPTSASSSTTNNDNINNNRTNATTTTNIPNNEDKLQPDDFWDDMCSALWNGKDRSASSNSRRNMINLALNPERNTGYNGTHIWRAIYDENCIVSNNNNDMCYEERVLYRLLSGLHSSTTISIAKHYYPPSKKKNRTHWESNPTYFMEHVYYNPEYIRNLHFTYVVLLRALSKASTFLYQYDFDTIATNDDSRKNPSMMNAEEREDLLLLHNEDDRIMTQKLVRRLLDSSILQSCRSVFSAFDESLMFQEETNNSSSSNSNTSMSLSSIFPNFSTNHTSSSNQQSSSDNQKVDVALLRQNFKGIFQNVSSILDCVQCQQCKLHGKLVMLGYGAALKILLNQNSVPELEHNEIIALINTVIKFSEAIKDVRELTNLYSLQQQREQMERDRNSTVVVVPKNMNDPTVKPGIVITKPILHGETIVDATTSQSDLLFSSSSSSMVTDVELVDLAVHVIATLGRHKRITVEREEELIQLVFQRNANLLLLAKHYHTDLDKFLKFSNAIGRIVSSTDGTTKQSTTANTNTDVANPTPDAIVIGSGLAGMATALNVLDRGGRVVIIEKEHVLGGNSGKASSGINACCPPNSTNDKDSMDLFWNDTFRSAGPSAQNELITTLISKSADAVTWLRTRLGVDLSLVAQLGGHSTFRTHRPKNGMVGAEIIYAIQKAIKSYVKVKQVTILTDTKVTKLLTDDHGAVIGVEYIPTDHTDGSLPIQLFAPNVVLATGGFASDRSDGSYLSQYRPELMKMPATAGPFSTGDGIKLATQLGAATVDMDKVQVHPTGWVDPADPDSRSKILAGELMRGVGGILLNSMGQRFCNELGTRAYVTNKMLEHDPTFAQTGNWSLNATVPTFSLVLSSSAADDGKKHVDLYTHKGLLTRLEGVGALAKWMKLPRDIVARTLLEYQKDAAEGIDSFGKQTFKGVPENDLDKEVFYAGTVTPVLHYCMGGVAIDKEGNVLNSQGEIIPGLHAAGEVSGGVHGVNRLGGNSLLECTVYGTIVGQKLPIYSTTTTISSASSNSSPTESSDDNSTTHPKKRSITTAELQRHNTPEDCWVAIHGVVYDLTDFAEEHPAGAQSIHELAGMDGTEAFAAVHNPQMLDDFDEEIKGVYSR